ncbi:MAG: hypothetical protein ABIO57_03720 [Candidatus Paceibacterota bacterium]
MRTTTHLPNDEYEELFDINLVAACVLDDIPIEAYNRDPKNAPRVGFLLRKSNKLKNLINLYLSGLLTVEPKQFAAEIRNLKARTKIPY